MAGQLGLEPVIDPTARVRECRLGRYTEFGPRTQLTETVLDDYELTGRFQAAEHVPDVVDIIVGLGVTRPAAEGMLSSPRWAMADALQLLDSDYGGIETYLRGPAGMTDATLADLRSRFVV